jgi:hypothetical protein
VIALVATLLVAFYVLGPDLIARWVLGFIVPRKNLVQTKSEEIARGVVWAILPFSLAWSLRHVGPLSMPINSKMDLQVFFSGLYSESYFNAHRQEFFSAANSFIKLNICVLARLYAVVLIVATLIDFGISRYGRMRHWLTRRRYALP